MWPFRKKKKEYHIYSVWYDVFELYSIVRRHTYVKAADISDVAKQIRGFESFHTSIVDFDIVE